jgi:hypothetical protein
MTPADEMAAKTATGPQSASAAADFDNQFEEQFRATVKDFQRASLQPRPADDLHGSEDVQSLLSRYLDSETSTRRAIYYRLQAIESAIKKRRSGSFVRYLVAIGIGVAATLAWQSYGEATKQIIATKAPELGWSPETKQMITGWMQELGWTKQPAGPESTAVRSSVPETPQPVPEPPAAPARKPTPTTPPSSRAPSPH